MNHPTIVRFIDECCPDTDTGWTWLRAMHEQGYTLDKTENRVQFVQERGVVVTRAVAGKIGWRAGVSGAAAAASPNTFEDPVAAAAWWAIERANMPEPPKQDPNQQSVFAQVAARQAVLARQAINIGGLGSSEEWARMWDSVVDGRTPVCTPTKEPEGPKSSMIPRWLKEFGN